MKVKKKKEESPYESVKIRKDVVELVRLHKSETRVPIGAFFEIAAKEKLVKNKK